MGSERRAGDNRLFAGARRKSAMGMIQFTSIRACYSQNEEAPMTVTACATSLKLKEARPRWTGAGEVLWQTGAGIEAGTFVGAGGNGDCRPSGRGAAVAR